MTSIFFVDQVQTLVAYLDPGSGSLMLQVVIAGAFSSLFFLKSSLLTVRCQLNRVFKHHA